VAPVELGLGDADGSIEIVVGWGRIQDLMAVVFEASRLRRPVSIASRPWRKRIYMDGQVANAQATQDGARPHHSTPTLSIKKLRTILAKHRKQ
jgi:hypothetical protein